MKNQVRMSSHGEVKLGTFEEVVSIPGRYLNDHCLVKKGNEWHFFGIVGDLPSIQKKPGNLPNETSFAHASSRDITRNWTVHPDVIGVCGVWPEIRNVYAPYVIEHGGVFYMLYCATDGMGTQRICLATSKDLFQWDRYAGNPVIVPSVFWSRWPGFGIDKNDGKSSFGGCRDPHIIKLDDGRFVAYWVSLLQERFGENLACVAASISHDLIHWQEIGPIFAMKTWHQPLTQEVESPCVIFKDGRYWLFFKNGWWTHFVVSDSPFDFMGCEPVRLGYCHASEIIFHDGQWWITHCKTDPDDYMQCNSDNSRGMFLGKLEWRERAYPELL